MSVEAFLERPWGRSHPCYEDSFINMRPAPEYSTAEVAVASLYRSCGFPGYSENDVPKAGRAFDSASANSRQNETGRISADGWRTIIHGILESPKQPKQSSRRFIQLCPIVPDIALYSGSARLSGNSWNPGSLIQRMLQLGTASQSDAEAAWRKIFAALTVASSDDIWARWLTEEFCRRRNNDPTWDLASMESPTGELAAADKATLQYPAKQFARDLLAVLEAKSSMTRRQWMSLIESIVRLGMVTHVLWLCTIGTRLWKASSAILGRGELMPGNAAVDARAAILAADNKFLSYGNQAMPGIRDTTSRYLQSRLGLNLLLWTIAEFGGQPGPLSSAESIDQFLTLISKRREDILRARFWENFDALQGTETRTILCKSGIGSNIQEFSRHTLGQRQSATETLRGYDQGYFLRKRSEARNSPFIVSLGPAAVLAVVHCCLRESAGPRSVQRLSDHLAGYGVEIDLDDIATSDLGKNLRMLGLVLDSPDAESGMLLMPPFTGTEPSARQ
ncbi:MAG: hypothetical protein U1F15_15390 [Burkholderiales bacterium]